MIDPLVVTQNVRLKKDHTLESKIGSQSGVFNRITLEILK